MDFKVPARTSIFQQTLFIQFIFYIFTCMTAYMFIHIYVLTSHLWHNRMFLNEIIDYHPIENYM